MCILHAFSKHFTITFGCIYIHFTWIPPAFYMHYTHILHALDTHFTCTVHTFYMHLTNILMHFTAFHMYSACTSQAFLHAFTCILQWEILHIANGRAYGSLPSLLCAKGRPYAAFPICCALYTMLPGAVRHKVSWRLFDCGFVSNNGQRHRQHLSGSCSQWKSSWLQRPANFLAADVLTNRKTIKQQKFKTFINPSI